MCVNSIWLASSFIHLFQYLLQLSQKWQEFHWAGWVGKVKNKPRMARNLQLQYYQNYSIFFSSNSVSNICNILLRKQVQPLNKFRFKLQSNYGNINHNPDFKRNVIRLLAKMRDAPPKVCNIFWQPGHSWQTPTKCAISVNKTDIETESQEWKNGEGKQRT